MNFPSVEFDDAVSALCLGTASERDVVGLHSRLRSDPAARDEYLWQVEMHARLAQMAGGEIGGIENVRWSGRSSGQMRLAVAAAVVMIFAGGLFWSLRNAHDNEKKTIAAATQELKHGSSNGMGFQMEGIYRETVRFAFASDAPVFVGTGRAEPIALGAEVPYTPAGDTLHIWDWSKSPLSRVMKDIRLWPTDVFAVSPDGKTLVIASGKVIDLASGEISKIDLGGEYYLDNEGGQLRRIQELQFTPDGKHLALRLSNIVLSKSTHPLRKEDFDTTRTIQIIPYPAGGLVCEVPAGFRGAFSQDGKRMATAMPEDKAKQQIVERNAVTGELMREYEPRLNEFAYATAYSPDGKCLAAFDSGGGDVLIWDTASGELKHRVHPRGNHAAYLRFSPDSKLLAVSLINKFSIIEVASGTIVGTVPQDIPAQIYWAEDGKSFDVVTTMTMTEKAGKEGQEVFDVFPGVKHWKLTDVEKK